MSPSAAAAAEAVAAKRALLQAIGRRRVGVSVLHSPLIVPPWFDRVAFKRAQTLFHDYAYVILLSQLYGILLAVHTSAGYAPFALTGHPSPSKLFSRCLSTLAHLRHWFTGDPFDPCGSKCHRSLKLIRGLHRQVLGLQQQQQPQCHTCSAKQYHHFPQARLSQAAMVQGQFVFVGLMAVFPEQLGFGHFSPSDFHALFHFWRTIGYCLGIEDRFNLCQGTDLEVVEHCRQLYWGEWHQEVVRRAASSSSSSAKAEFYGLKMARSIAVAALPLGSLPGSLPAMLRFGAPFLGLEKARYPLETIRDRIKYAELVLILRWLPVRLRRWYRRFLELFADEVYHQHNRQQYSGFSNDCEHCQARKSTSFNYTSAFEANL
ncbi:hypothetical protein TYRP_017382 [Tyrophagus putrescentiae]|nr:hypothetical protein TYRP_017382 [Tyrophagus putrescentiae]